MKNSLRLFCFFIMIEMAMAQNTPMHCFSNINRYPKNKVGFFKAERKAMESENLYKSQNGRNSERGVTITIPVVFHVVYKNAAQNIPDSMIYSQIQVLNECFRKTNSNYSQTRPIFDSLGADIEIEFCLAQKDPQGNPTTGIVRKQAPSNASFDPLFGFDNIKKPSKGGDTLWNPRHYLNIWTCDMSLFGQEVVLGYAQFPGMDSLTDGVVIQYNYLGKYSKPGFLGRTTVHEVGHWLGLRHIWADDDIGSNGSNCDSTDYVDDTPNQGPRSNSNCNFSAVTCTQEASFWGSLNPPDMIENYMDYSRDSCMTLFTKGQKNRIYGFLHSDPVRMAIKTSTASCNPLQSINDYSPSLSESVFLFPQPAHSSFKIAIPNTIILFDVDLLTYEGKKSDITLSITNELEFSVSKVPKGIYILRLNTNKGLIYKKLIKE